MLHSGCWQLLAAVCAAVWLLRPLPGSATYHAHCEALCAWLLVMMAMVMPQKCAATVLKPCLLTSSIQVR